MTRITVAQGPKVGHSVASCSARESAMRLHAMSMPVRIVCLVVGALLAVPLMGANCFPRQCQDASHCYRQCTCTEENGLVAEGQCGVYFKCETETQTCEEQQASMDCNAFCEQFAGNLGCEGTRCDDERDCGRVQQCSAQGQDGTPFVFNCTVQFECGVHSKVCEQAYSMAPDAFCATYGAACLAQAQSTP